MDQALQATFEQYKQKFKALADEKRLQIMNILANKGSSCVCDIQEEMGMSQSKLSYHLKILKDADLVEMSTKGTWSYYTIKETTVYHLLSDELCCLFIPSQKAKNTSSCCGS
ncbi:MAG: helix-turn-helix transcriptional regulator [Bacillaceae bacterium]|nr:helix-turn-helix transcriptional regulator [Bacillaceae bacterium]